MEVTERFAQLVQGPEEELDERLDEACLLIAAHAHEGLDVGAWLARLDAIAATCPEPTLDALVDHLFVTLSFAGNEQDYHDPRNSFLDDVIDRRLGIPITLAVVAMAVGRRVGVRLQGVGMPGHFLLRHESVPPVLLDPFDHGRRLTPSDCEARFEAIAGPGVPFSPAFLEPVGARAVVARVLANLRQVAVTHGDIDMLSWVVHLRSSVPGVGPGDLSEVARVQARRGRFDEAAATLEHLATVIEDDDESTRLGHEALRLRARLN